MSFPPSAKDIRLFEKNNSNLSINIYGLDQHYTVTGPLYHFERQQKINFVIYADFESLLCNYDEENTNKNTIKNKLHLPSCFAYY
ncbi:hypothetical protein SFRURICE_003829, partial [Spodoptera frugiperda]